jgi:pilus assembly protein TadC
LLFDAFPMSSLAVGIFAQISPSSLLNPNKGHSGFGDGESRTFLRGFFFTGFFLTTAFFVALAVVVALAVAFALTVGLALAVAVAFAVGLGVGDFVAAIAAGVSRVNAMRKAKNFFNRVTI